MTQSVTSSLAESWHPIRGFEDFYAVSDQGKVRSLERVIVFEHPIGGVIRHRLHEKLLSIRRCPRTHHMAVTLCREGSVKHCALPRLVLEAFVGPCPDGCHATTLNDDPSDCRLLNLAWRPIPVIVQHAIDRGIRPVGDRHYKAKLTAAEVLAIRESGGEPARVLAARYGMNKNTIAAIRRGTIWKSLIPATLATTGAAK